MKKLFLYKSIAAIVLTLGLVVACTENIADVRLDPRMATTEVQGISSAQATVVGFVIAEGSGFSERGVCYGLTTEPTVDDNKVVFDDDVTGATFSVTITGLDYATTYYARAYAINATGTIYGDEMTFTTLPVVPTVTTTAITDISYTSATGGGEVTVTGGADVTARGICYSTGANPTIDNEKTSDGDGLGVFTSSLTNLMDGTTYYVRAYATNSAGTGYGEEETFTTLVPQDRTWYIPGDYVAASYPGTEWADWSPDKSPIVKSGLSDPDNLQGYVYMANETNNWKFATQPNWDGPNYGDGGGGTLDDDPGAANMSSTQGYYLLRANANDLTYTALATEWGIIGDATPNGWTDETALTYDPTLQKWIGAYALTAGEVKFRSNHSWDAPNPNYGSDDGDGTLDEGGANIAVSEAGEYAVTLDLSQPLAYAYRIDMWGLIGSATPDSWDSDQDMIWDPVGGVFTITLDLVAGEMKFRANNAWDYDLGGDIAALTPGGSNIAVAADGNYTITLDPWNMVATVTAN